MRRVHLSLSALVLGTACRMHKPTGNGTALPVTDDPPLAIAAPETRRSDPPAPTAAPAAATVERVAVPGDVPAAIVRGPSGTPPRIVFMPGRCSNAYAYLLSFPEAARAHGGVIAIDGDKPCGAAGSGFRSFTWDPARQDARIAAALAAAAGTTTLPNDGFTLIGYSAGAGIGELMVQLWPDRYPRVVLIGAPSDPRHSRLAHARAVVTMSCALDVPGRMKGAARRIEAAGVPATYIEMPGCTHGNVGDGERVFAAAFDWFAAMTR